MKKLIFPLLFILCFAGYLWSQQIGPGAGMIGGLPSNLYQPLDSDLTTIGGLTSVQNKILIGNSTPAWSVSSWTIATPTTGGLFYGSNTTAISVLAAGTQNKILQMGASLPAWSTYTVTLSGNTTLNDWFDQAVKVASTPTFGGLTVTGLSGMVLASTGTLGAATAGTDYLAPTTPEVIVTKNASYTLGTDASKENYGGLVYLTAAATLTLPSAVSGMNGCVMSTGTFSISVDVNIADHWVLNGTALTAGNKVTSTGVTGDTLCWSCGAANTWYILPGTNVNWIDGS